MEKTVSKASPLSTFLDFLQLLKTPGLCLEMRVLSSLGCHLLVVWAPYYWQSWQDFLSAFISPGKANLDSGTWKERVYVGTWR